MKVHIICLKINDNILYESIKLYKLYIQINPRKSLKFLINFYDYYLYIIFIIINYQIGTIFIEPSENNVISKILQYFLTIYRLYNLFILEFD